MVKFVCTFTSSFLPAVKVWVDCGLWVFSLLLQSSHFGKVGLLKQCQFQAMPGVMGQAVFFSNCFRRLRSGWLAEFPFTGKVHFSLCRVLLRSSFGSPESFLSVGKVKVRCTIGSRTRCCLCTASSRAFWVGRLTMRAPDAGESPRFSGSIHTSAFFRLDGFAVPRPSAGNAHR